MAAADARRDGQQRILLVKPPLNDAGSRYYAPPLGVLSLAAWLRRRGDAEVRVLHLHPRGPGWDEAGGVMREWRPHWVGVSALTFESKGLHRAAAAAKEADPGVRVVAGGPHASFYTDDVMADPNVDFAVIGEGELTADDLARAMRDGSGVEGIDGLAWRQGGAVHVSPRSRYVEDLDALPFPAWDLVNLSAYRGYDRMSRIGSGSYAGLLTSRACPYRCAYCHQLFGKKFRARSPEGVLAEVRALHDEHGVRELEIIDDCFNLDLARAKRIFDLIAGSGMKLRISFPNGVRGDRVDEEFFRKARRAGVAAMSIAVETASPRIQRQIHKNLDLGKIEEGIAMARASGIMTLGFFMLGFPGETREELRMTVDFAVRSKLHAVNFFAVTPFEGTELADIARRMGKPVFGDFDQMYMGGGVTNLTDLPDEELRRIRQRAVMRFWLSPGRVWSMLRDYPDKAGLPRLAAVLLKRLLLKA